MNTNKAGRSNLQHVDMYTPGKEQQHSGETGTEDKEQGHPQGDREIMRAKEERGHTTTTCTAVPAGAAVHVDHDGARSVKANPNPAPATRKPGTRGNPREFCLQKPGPDWHYIYPRGLAAARASGLGPGFCCCARARWCSQCAAAQPAGCGCCAARGSSRRLCVPSRTEVAP